VLRPNYRIFPSIFAVILWGLLSPLFAADSTFRVDSYIPEKFVDLSWRITGGTGLDGNDEETSNSYDYGRHSHNEDNNDSYSLNFGTLTEYRYEIIPFNLYLNVDGKVGFSEGENHSEGTETNIDGRLDRSIDKTRYTNYDLLLNNSLKLKKYLSGNHYVAFDTKLDLQYRDNPETFTSHDTDIYFYSEIGDSIFGAGELSIDRSGNTREYRGTIQTGWGIGRIYDGRAAATALNIIAELRKEKLLAREPDFSEFYSLTQLLYGFQQEHKVDTRWHRIKSLTSLIEYLEAKGIYNGGKAVGPLIIQDVWDYYPNDIRNFGIRNELGFGVDYSLSRQRQMTHFSQSYFQIVTDSNQVPDTTHDVNSERSSKLYIENRHNDFYLYWKLDFNKPISLRFQVNLALDWRFYFHDKSINDVSGNQLIPTYDGNRTETVNEYEDKKSLSNTVELNYYFDSRTSGTLGVITSYQRYELKRYTKHIIPESYTAPDTSYQKQSILILVFMTEFKYRINPETTIGGSISYEMEDVNNSFSGHDIEQNDDKFSFSISINHFIF